jgi:hypothetical protein
MISVKPGQPASNGKKEYQRPQLVCYGDVALLTRGGKGKGTESGAHSGGSSRMCLVAEVLYGVDTPRTHLVRCWLMDRYERRKHWALIVVPLYRRLGKRIAPLARRYSIVSDALRPLFDSAVRRSLRQYASVQLGERFPQR